MRHYSPFDLEERLNLPTLQFKNIHKRSTVAQLFLKDA